MSSKLPITPAFRVSFPALTEKTEYKDKSYYAVTALVDKDLDSNNILPGDKAAFEALTKAAIDASIQAYGGGEKGKKAWQRAQKGPKYTWPFRDGSEKEQFDGYDE